jgi:hypothetical protein
MAVFAQEASGLLMDNHSAPVSDAVIHTLTEIKVLVIDCAPKKTQIFQILDLTLLGVFRRRSRYELPFGDDLGTVIFAI